MQGSPVTQFVEMNSGCFMLLMSIHPFSEELTTGEENQIVLLKNRIIAAHWDSGILLEQFVLKVEQKRKLRQDFISK